MKNWKFALFLGATFIGKSARADVKMPTIFGDNMVLQQEQNLPIWGWADAGENVSVSLGEATAQAVADEKGNWKVVLAPQKVAESLELKVAGKNGLLFKNVAIGEVWLCSGQSNMELPVSRAKNFDDEKIEANYSKIRMFTTANVVADTPQNDVPGSWVVCSPETVGNFSAVGYFFGRDLHQKLDVPIGLIHTSWGGTPADAWTSRSALEAAQPLKPVLDYWDKRVADFEAQKAKFETEMLPAWQIEADKAKAVGLPTPPKPRLDDPTKSTGRPANLFNAKIAPLIPFAIKGVIWYQGEANAGNATDAERYRTLFPTLIGDWRSRWGEGDFPFYFVQLANYLAPQTQPVEDTAWPLLREAQAMALVFPLTHTGMVTAIDLANFDQPDNIHPRNKQEVGRRLALIALANDYGQKVEFSGPQILDMFAKGDKIWLLFGHAKGLQARGEKLQGFAIAGEDGVWKWADAQIDDYKIVLSNPEIPKPIKARYCWAMNPIGNLYNGAGLPAVPFRTDAPIDIEALKKIRYLRGGGPGDW